MDPLTHLLKLTCDVLEDVLDSYKETYSPTGPSNCHQIFKDVKSLFSIAQKLESEAVAGAFRSTSARARRNISEVLNECGQLAKLLQTRIEARILQEDASISRDIETYHAEIVFFLRTYGRTRDPPATVAECPERLELENLRHLYDEAQSTIETLNTMIDERNDRLREALHDSSPTECDCDARLSHIRRLHTAIDCLIHRFPRDHGLDSWEELSGELPHMLDHMRGIDEKLKELTVAARSPSPTPTRASTAHRRHKSEPEHADKSRSSRSARPRPPSPALSNISIARDSVVAAGSSDRSRNRKARASGFFSNQGG